MKTEKSVSKRMSRRGQITIFIILGIIILFLVALAIYLQSSSSKVRPPVQQLVVDAEVEPIQSYVTDCLSAVSKDALIRLGQNGGYINIPTGMRVNPARPYDSDVLYFAPQVMPYWYYMKPCAESSIGCIIINNPPVCDAGTVCTIPYTGPNSMESQLNKFIEDNIAVCINNFSPFTDRFDITGGDIKVISRIADSTVGFELDYPLTIVIKGSNRQSQIPYFYTEQDVKLKRIYALAQDIRNAEANYSFLERSTLNLISAYSDIDPNKLPPMSGLDMFKLNQVYWIRSDVKQKLMSDILPYTMLLQIANAGNAKTIIPRGTDPKYIPFEQGLYRGMMLVVSNTTSYPDLDANLYYPPGADIYFRIGNSEIIKPKASDAGDDIILKMIGFAMKDYSFRYDLTYPVIVKISDPDAFKGEGYTFSYAMQANIRQNVPINTNMTVTQIATIPSVDLEDTNLRLNKTITIETYNKYTKQPLEGVQIEYKCGYDISMGATVMKNGKAVLQDKFPFCELGGEIDYEKDGYMGGAIDYSNNDNATINDFRIEMWPLQEKQIKVYKRTEADINSIRKTGAGGIVLYSTAYSELGPNDTVFVNIARTKDDVRETDVPTVGFASIKQSDSQITNITRQDQVASIKKLFTDGMINQTTRDEMLNDLNFVEDTPIQTITTPQEYTMDFVPGEYNIDAFMTYDGTIVIPEDIQTTCTFPIMGVCLSESKTNYSAQNFTGWMTGGVNLNFTLTEHDVYSNNTLVFFVAEMPIPTNWDMLMNAPTLEDYQSDKIALLRPTVKYG